jgi:hypothetical protein
MSVAEKLNPDAAEVFAGHVDRSEGGTFVVRGDGIVARARRAPSCVLAPEQGDRVLLARTGEGRVYVLAVLERDEDTAQRWSADGDVTIEARGGRVDVTGTTAVGIASPGELSLQAGALSFKSRVAKLATGKLAVLGQEVLAEVARSRLVAGAIESVAEVVSQTASRVSRVVTEIEHVRAGTVDIAAEKSLAIHAENAMVTAKALVKMDGEAVQLG